MKLGIEGKVAVVTGASRGIGRATSRALANEGARLVLAGYDAYYDDHTLGSRGRERSTAELASLAAAFNYLFETVEKNGESVVGCGTYDDHLRREGRVWRFEEKIITVLFMTPVLRGWAGSDRIVSWG